MVPADLREAIHVGREANLVLFVVDASGSMAARHRMTIVKTAVLSLLRDAYQRRDKVGMITFRGTTAELVLPPTSSHEVGRAAAGVACAPAAVRRSPPGCAPPPRPSPPNAAGTRAAARCSSSSPTAAPPAAPTR